MAYITRQLPTLTAATTGTNANTNAIGGLDDASAITFFFISTANYLSSALGLSLQVSMFDPSQESSANERGTVVSTNYHSISSAIFSTGAGLITSSGVAYTIPFNNMGAWRGLRISGLTSAASGEKVAFVTKMIQV